MKKIFCYLFSVFIGMAFATPSIPNIKKVEINAFSAAEVELILNNGYAPLTGFMGSQDYHSILETMRTKENHFWPIPITLPIKSSIAANLQAGEDILLVDETNFPLACMHIEEIYDPKPENESLALFNTTDDSHPYIFQLLNRKVKYLAGPINAVGKYPLSPFHFYISTPEQIHTWKKENNITTLVGFQTRNPLHAAHVTAIRSSIESLKEIPNKALLLHPTIGSTQKGDIPPSVRMRCYESILPEFSDMHLKLSAIPLPMRMAGPKEALLHALVRKNYGCTHFIVGRDHAGPSVRKKDGSPYFGLSDSLDLALKHQNDMGISILPCHEFFYVPEENAYKQKKDISPDQHIESISGTQLRQKLKNNESIPTWFSYPQVIDILKNYFGASRGFCVYLTGLPASGKSTLCQLLKNHIEELDRFQRRVVILDADIIRKHLNAELGFSKEDRSKNVRRIGYVASKIVEAGGICLIANIAPFEADRQFNRKQISKQGGYFEVFVNVPISACIDRDPKGLYHASMKGYLSRMTGISQEYEIPQSADIVIDNHQDLNRVMDKLKSEISPLITHYLSTQKQSLEGKGTIE
ncbi:MAG: sulfate adenylyltransferase [Simkaniaceae bacterium]|nr:sulfate adenylyltransferase [Simkaniaceae bacterium]